MSTYRSIKNNALLSLLIGMGFLLSACKTHFYPVVDSYQEGLFRNEDGSFGATRDSLSVTYSFKDSGGNVVYEIHNASSDPVFVDWSRSVLIAEDHAVQLRDNIARFDGRAITTTYQFSNSNYGVHTSDISGQIVLPQNDLFIPPRSKIEYSPMSLSRILNLDILPASLFQKRDVGYTPVKFVKFSEENTPLKFRSYLTIVNDRDKTRTVFEDQFFISEIVKTSSKNSLLDNDVMRRGDMFYIEKTNDNAVIWGWIATGAAVTAGIILLSPHLPEVPPTQY